MNIRNFWSKYLVKYYRDIITSIAFLPTIIIMAFLALAVLMVEIEHWEIEWLTKKYLPFLIIDNANTARSLLSTLIGGLLSLTVFSFSMVMIVLNQASSQFSPRILPGIISKKSHQTVLGIYIGTLIYSLIVLANVERSLNNFAVPSFSIFVAILSGLLCITLFVYFIHDISSSIKPDYILQSIYDSTLAKLLHQKNSFQQENLQPDTFQENDWPRITSRQTGVVQEVLRTGIFDYATEQDLQLKVLVCPGETLLSGTDLFSSPNDISAEQKKAISRFFVVSKQELDLALPQAGFKQVVEILQKAMSPGINDPGTALSALNVLGHLLASRIQLHDWCLQYDEQEKLRVILKLGDFPGLLYIISASIRQYIKHDVVVCRAMVTMYEKLLGQPAADAASLKVIRSEIAALKEDIESGIQNATDRAYLQRSINDLLRRTEALNS